MKRAEQHVIERTHPQFRAIDRDGLWRRRTSGTWPITLSGSRFFFSRNTSTTQQFSMSSNRRRPTQRFPLKSPIKCLYNYIGLGSPFLKPWRCTRSTRSGFGGDLACRSTCTRHRAAICWYLNSDVSGRQNCARGRLR